MIVTVALAVACRGSTGEDDAGALPGDAPRDGGGPNDGGLACDDHLDCPHLGSCNGYCVEGQCGWPAIRCWDGSVQDPNYISCATPDDCPARPSMHGCGRPACVFNQCAWHYYEQCDGGPPVPDAGDHDH